MHYRAVNVYRCLRRKYRRRNEGFTIMIAFKEAKREISTMIHPRSAKVLKYEGKVIGNDTLRVFKLLYHRIFYAVCGFGPYCQPG